MPPAPGMLSTTSCWPSSSDIRGVMMRPTTSIGPPAANGTTIVTGRAGQSCADAPTVATVNAASVVKMMRVDVLDMVVSAPNTTESSLMMPDVR